MLESGLRDIDGIELLMPTQANAVFARLPGAVVSRLRDRGWRFYTFIGSGGVRLMCSWDTTEDDVTDFLNDVRALCQEGAGEPAKQTHA
jgi:threonine aldolase